MCHLLELIENSQNGNNDCLLVLLEQFSPLLKFAAYRLGREDAYQDLQLFFIILIKKLKISKLHSKCDAAFVAYFKQTIDHHVIYLRRKQSKDKLCQSFEDLGDCEKLRYEAKTTIPDTYDEMLETD